MADALECNPKTLCFLNVGAERGFLRSRQAKLAKYAFLCFCLPLAFTAANFVLFLFRGWSTGGEIFVASAEGMRLAEARSWTIGSAGLVFMIVMVISKSHRLTACLGARGFEAVLVVAACLIVVLTTLQHPWYLVKALSIASPESVISATMDWTDDKLLLMLDIWLTGCHLLLPIRWIMLWPMELAVVLIYIGAAGVLGSHIDPHRVAMNALLMSLLVLAAALGKRALEQHERIAFTQLAVERTLRFEAEHKLSEMTEARAKEPAMDALSIPATAYTSDLFDSQKDTHVESRLEKLMKLGLREHWLIRPEELQLTQHKVLGTGGFGMALVARYHGTEVVLKVPRTSRDKAQTKLLPAMAEELRIFRRLHHPNIVTFYGACIDLGSSEIILILEYIRGQELGTAITGIPNTPLAVGDRCGLLDNICSALSYLHAQTPLIIHGDIKAANVLVEQFGARHNAKLLDFGLSRLLTRRPCTLGGTVRWMAPEVIAKDECAARPSADIFSLGRLAFMTMTGRMPLDGLGRDEIIDAVRRGENLALDWPTDMPLLREARELCDACLGVSADSRPDITQVQASLHQWGRKPDMPDDLAAVLWNTFPHPSGCGDLQEALQKARADHTASRIRTSPRGAVNTASPSTAGGAPPPQMPAQTPPTAQLLAPLFDATPERSRIRSISFAVSAWNIPVPTGACCTMHALTQELQAVTDRLKAQTCKHVSIVDGWQCPKCKLMGEDECEICGPADVSSVETSRSERRRQALETLPEVPEAEGDGQHAVLELQSRLCRL